MSDVDDGTTDSISTVILKPSFAVPFSSVTTSFILLGYYMEQQGFTENSEANPDVRFVYPELWINVLSYVICTSAMLYFASFRITASVAEGNTTPVSLARLKSLPWPISWICGFEGERYFFLFLFQMILFPGLTLLLGLHTLSYINTGTLFEWYLPLDLYLASNSLWRLIATSIIFGCNFFSASNPSQSLVKEALRKG